ncbi:hypothetical protein CALCODRAFT_327894 [Calocera cornea HHB12733]|uniref:Uncharacterized protein n=1 Tax=Calocera cornea HHB12733 TaxID=1353952 RepID=A0A165JH93_9BASI|nr:hypothetical protein CALCODRAFT_327894 [Calocera cornea HHB12733]
MTILGHRCCTQLLNIFFYTHQFDEGIAFWKELDDSVQYSDAAVSILIDRSGWEARLDVAESVWKTYRSRRRSDANTWGAWLECLSRVSRQSFLRARDILFFEMGINCGDDGTPPADLGFTRIILSFAARYDVLEETVEGVKTHLPTIWPQLQADLHRPLPLDKDQAAHTYWNLTGDSEYHGKRNYFKRR